MYVNFLYACLDFYAHAVCLDCYTVCIDFYASAEKVLRVCIDFYVFLGFLARMCAAIDVSGC